jgi:hypothetical protein
MTTVLENIHSTKRPALAAVNKEEPLFLVITKKKHKNE